MAKRGDKIAPSTQMWRDDCAIDRVVIKEKVKGSLPLAISV